MSVTPVRQDYTFQELCPEWSKRVGELDDVKKLREYKDDMHTHEFCVVGEAYIPSILNGVSGLKKYRKEVEEKKRVDNLEIIPYYRRCERCLLFAEKIALSYSTYRPQMIQHIAEFVEHFNEKHRGVK